MPTVYKIRIRRYLKSVTPFFWEGCYRNKNLKRTRKNVKDSKKAKCAEGKE